LKIVASARATLPEISAIGGQLQVRRPSRLFHIALKTDVREFWFSGANGSLVNWGNGWI
jgi:hypothetical protein